MHKIGITGGIGSGKSTVCEIFIQLEVPVFNADEEAKKLLEYSEVKEFYKNEFGEKVFTGDRLDKQKIASIIFNDQKALLRVNEFIHPKVIQVFDEWCKKHQKEYYIIHEAALLFESKANILLDQTILVIAPLELRINRIMLRDLCEKASVLKRIENQWPDNKKIKLADFVISNDEQSLLLPQVLRLHQIFCSKEIIK